MRFAYIDSQGKEIPIPSVEALQLRIELGAIGRETMFFDRSGEGWAPAREHEVFRTLWRELQERDAAAFGDPSDEAGPTGTESAAGEPASPGPPEGEAAAARAAATGPTSAEAASGPEATGTAGAPTEPTVLSIDDLAPDVPPTPAEPHPVEPAATVPGAGPAAPPAGKDASFDFGEFGELELEAEPADAAPEAGIPASGGTAAGAPVPFDPDALDTLDVEPAVPQQGVPELPEDEVFDFGPFDGSALEDEESAEPVAESTTAAESEADPAPPAASATPPGWLEEGEPLQLEDPAAASWARPPSEPDPEETGAPHGVPGTTVPDPDAPQPASGSSAPERPSSPQDRRPSRARPAPPPTPRRRSRPPVLLLGLVVVALVSAGAWYGWARTAPDAAPEAAAAPALPPLPDDLRATWASTAPAAWQSAIDSIRASGATLPGAPDPAWLGGAYLANAGRYGGIADYWQALRGWLDRTRAEDESVFLGRFRAALDAAAVPAPERELLVERARAGFQLSAPEREVVYDRLGSLVDASLDLHAFLLENEGAIEYEPAASGLSRDPITEAVPATPELGDAMWDRVGAVGDALDAVGPTDRVTTPALLDLLASGLERTEVR